MAVCLQALQQDGAVASALLLAPFMDPVALSAVPCHTPLPATTHHFTHMHLHAHKDLHGFFLVNCKFSKLCQDVVQ